MKELNINETKSLLEKYKQSHLLEFWNELSSVEKNSLFEELNTIQFENISKIYNDALSDLKQSNQLLDSFLEPVNENDLGNFIHSKQLHKQYQKIGLQKIREGKVAVILMAGGVGSRLGVNYPKGMFDVGLLSKKTLYQLQAQRIVKLNQIAYQTQYLDGDYILPSFITWCIMTSDKTLDETKLYFESHNYFGLPTESVIFFKQYSIPCLDMDGKIILESKGKVAMSPEGNGGLYRALVESNVLTTLEERGIEYLHVYGVDNILVKVADPVFLGFCVEKKAECGVKVIEKKEPKEAVGVVCKVKGRYQVVEYSEISSETAHKTTPDGTQLLFNCGNIANHFFSMNFLKMACTDHVSLRYHVAKKKIGYVDKEGQSVRPDKPNGIKMEKFIFDVFPLAKKLAVWLVERDEEFSPLKNADTDPNGSNPRTCREDLYALHKKYLEKAGGQLFTTAHQNGLSNGNNKNLCNDHNLTNSCTNNGHVSNGTNGTTIEEGPDFQCEISPLVSYAGENLEEYVKDKRFLSPFLLNEEVEDEASIITLVDENGLPIVGKEKPSLDNF